MPLDIAWSFFWFSIFGIFFFDFVGFIFFFFDLFFHFSWSFYHCWLLYIWVFIRRVRFLDALGVVVQSSPLPLFPFSLPVAIGSILTV